VIALVGNKLDLCEEDDGAEEEQDEENADDHEEATARKVSSAEAKAYADEESLLFFETSAKTGHNVSEVFTAIANAIPETSLKGPRGATGGGTQAAISGQDSSRVNLNAKAGNGGPKEGCAC
jgi:Ras-related protein Rab-5C